MEHLYVQFEFSQDLLDRGLHGNGRLLHLFNFNPHISLLMIVTAMMTRAISVNFSSTCLQGSPGTNRLQMEVQGSSTT